MAALLVGVISGIICAAISAVTGASWLSVFVVYVCSGIVATLSHAIMISVIEPTLTKRRGPTKSDDDWRSPQEP